MRSLTVLDISPTLKVFDQYTRVTVKGRHRIRSRPQPIKGDAAKPNILADELHAPIDLDSQQWFSDGSPGIETLAPLFVRFDEVYGAGEFTTAGLWTASDPPPETIEEMAGAWEYETGPILRWWLPVVPTARVFEIHRPQDWADLVASHPRLGEPHGGWELPGTNHDVRAIADALTSRTFIVTTLAFFACGFQLIFIATHLPPNTGFAAAVHAAWAEAGITPPSGIEPGERTPGAPGGA